MRASSPWLAVAAAAGLLLCTLSSVSVAEPVEITIRAADSAAMSDASVVEVHQDVAAVTAAMKAYAASALPPGVVPAAKAVSAAREAGLEQGVAPWRVTLSFNAVLGTTIWRVTNMTSEDPGNLQGRTFTVDAASGRVVARDRWHAIVG